VPELDDGADDDALRPLEPALLDVLEPEPDATELPEPLDAAEDAEPDAADLCTDPGKMKETTPAMTRPATPAAAVVARSRPRPRSRAATVQAIECCCRLLIPCTIAPCSAGPLRAPSQNAMSYARASPRIEGMRSSRAGSRRPLVPGPG